MTVNDIFHVLVALPLASVAGRKKLSGIHRFLGEGRTWDIELVRNEREFTEGASSWASATGYDGIIIGFTENRFFRGIRPRHAVPIVFLDYPDAVTLKRNPYCVFIQDDATSIARVAAQQFLKSCRARTYGFVPSRQPTPWSDERQRAFAAEMKRRGHRVACYADGGGDRETLARWIDALPKPASILCAFDDRANTVLETCRELGLSVPREAEVLGIGNDAPICEAAFPRLSSVAVDFENQGYRAARELQAMMLRRHAPKIRTFRYGAIETVCRASTVNPDAPQLLARQAMDYIVANAVHGIGVRDVVRHLRVSRRLADLRFREATGTTLNEAILVQRLDAVKRLLRETDLPIADIAVRCGYANANYLKNLFLRRNGLSMRDYRRSSVCGGPVSS